MFVTDLDGTLVIDQHLPEHIHKRLHDMQQNALVIPATARSLEQYQRLGLVLPYAIITNGCQILINHQISQDYAKHIENLLPDTQIMHDFLTKYYHQYVCHDTYIFKVQHQQKDSALSDTDYALAFNKATEDFVYSKTDTHIYFAPKRVNKYTAVHYLEKQLNKNLVVAAGDNDIDECLLQKAPFAFAPVNNCVKYINHLLTYETVEELLDAAEVIMTTVHSPYYLELRPVLYAPANKHINLDKFDAQTAICFDFEDAFHGDTTQAIDNVKQIIQHKKAQGCYIRPKDIQQAIMLDNLFKNSVLDGYILPKINPYLDEKDINKLKQLSKPFIPIIEADYAYTDEEIIKLKRIIKTSKSRSCRIGATDLASRFGVRRTPQQTIYDLLIMHHMINHLTRHLGDEFILSGVVNERIYPDDSFEKEVNLEVSNGYFGKTCIHPNQLPVVKRLHQPKLDNIIDALNILTTKEAVWKNASNQMSEKNPHKKWAERTLLRAYTYPLNN